MELGRVRFMSKRQFACTQKSSFSNSLVNFTLDLFSFFFKAKLSYRSVYFLALSAPIHQLFPLISEIVDCCLMVRAAPAVFFACLAHTRSPFFCTGRVFDLLPKVRFRYFGAAFAATSSCTLHTSRCAVDFCDFMIFLLAMAFMFNCFRSLMCVACLLPQLPLVFFFATFVLFVGCPFQHWHNCQR